MTKLTLHAPIDGWLCPLEDVPDAVFAGRMLGDGLAIDPLGGTLYAPADAVVVHVHEAGHAITLRFDHGIELLLHFGLETVRLKGEGFTPLVKAGDQVRSGTPLLHVAVDAVADQVKSLMTPMVLTATDHCTIEHTSSTGLIRQGDVMMVLRLEQGASPDGAGEPSSSASPGQPTSVSPAISADVRVPLAHGLHARPCAKLAEMAKAFDADIRLSINDKSARLRSPTMVLALGINHGDTISISASGPEAEKALATIAAAISDGMGEGAPFPDARDVASDHALTPDEKDSNAGVFAPPAVGEILSGVCAAPGLAIGLAWHLAPPEPEIAETASDSAAEAARFDAARHGLRDRLSAALTGDGSAADAIEQAHCALLDDEDIIAATHDAITAGASAGHAWRQVMHAQVDALRASPNPRFAERASDLLDLEIRLQWAIAGQEMPPLIIPKGAIILADDLMPSQVAALDAEHVAGIVTAQGGPTSHVAIIAASRGIATLVAVGERVLAIASDTPLILDSSAGTLEVAPPSDHIETARTRLSRLQQRKTDARASITEEGRTRDGKRIEIFANLGNRAEAASALEQGAEGCGLLRSEFLFLDRATAPNEAEQSEDYAAIAMALGGRPLIIRLLDIGGDKPAPYLPIAAEENPALGLRGIRVGLTMPHVLREQIRAIVRASGAGDVRLMAPMIARVEELRAVKAMLAEEAQAMGVTTPLPPLGVMVETPAAAIMADRLAAECDFLSIGTNDLTQYMLAMDRGNPAVAASLDGLDPAVLRMIRQCCLGAAGQGKWVGVCGGLASDPLAVPILLGLGITELSVAPAMVAEIKALVRALDLNQCERLAQDVLGASTARDVRAMARAMAEEAGL